MALSSLSLQRKVSAWIEGFRVLYDWPVFFQSIISCFGVLIRWQTILIPILFKNYIKNVSYISRGDLTLNHVINKQKTGSVAEWWPSDQRVGLAIRRSRVRVPLWPLAGFVLGLSEFKFSATLVNSQLVAFCQLGFLILLCCIWIICF